MSDFVPKDGSPDTEEGRRAAEARLRAWESAEAAGLGWPDAPIDLMVPPESQ